MSQKHDPGIQKKAKQQLARLTKSEKLSVLIWSKMNDPVQRPKALEYYTKEQIKTMFEFRKQKAKY